MTTGSVEMTPLDAQLMTPRYVPCVRLIPPERTPAEEFRIVRSFPQVLAVLW
jgi:hypothetical protein